MDDDSILDVGPAPDCDWFLIPPYDRKWPNGAMVHQLVLANQNGRWVDVAIFSDTLFFYWSCHAITFD
jgi:hypothetical protein